MRPAAALALDLVLGLALSATVAAPSALRAQGTLPFVKRHIYSETANPRVEIAAALKQARAEHKRVLLDFGGDWCGDCQVLDIYFHQQPNEGILTKRFVVVHIFIPEFDRNGDLASQYGVDLAKGVPALAVLDASGKALTAHSTVRFDTARSMSPAMVTDYLNHWKG